MIVSYIVRLARSTRLTLGLDMTTDAWTDALALEVVVASTHGVWVDVGVGFLDVETVWTVRTRPGAWTQRGPGVATCNFWSDWSDVDDFCSLLDIEWTRSALRQDTGDLGAAGWPVFEQPTVL